VSRFVDTQLSASRLGDRLEERRIELRATLPIGRARHDQHGTHRRDLRHRRLPAVRLMDAGWLANSAVDRFARLLNGVA
jgi:hypothetical protein